MEYVKDIHGSEYRTDNLFSLMDLWENARQFIDSIVTGVMR